MLLLLPLCAQPPQEGGRKGPPAPKNLKILKPEDIRPMMRAFTVALGQNCTFCHVQGDFANDEKPQKTTARHMIEMTQHLNQQFNAAFNDSKEYVTCYTCHRGASLPLTAPPAPPPAGGN